MYILLILVVFAVFIFFMGKLMVAYATKLTEIFVGSKHRDAEEILASGYLPMRWLVNTRGKKPRMRRGVSKAGCIQKLKKIIDYFKRTPMVEDENTREQLLDRLKSILKTWVNAEFEEIKPPNI